MNIAIFHELHAGGARRTVNEFAKQLTKEHEVDLYIIDEEVNKEEEQFFSKTFCFNFFAKKWSGNNWKVKLYKDTIELYKLYKLHKTIAKQIDRKQYDFVFVHPSQFTQTPFLLRFLKTKTIYYCEEPLRISYESFFDLDKKLPLTKKIYEKFNRLIRKKIDRKNFSYADLVLANSKHTQKKILSAYGRTSIVNYLGVDTEIFKPKQLKKDIDILYIGAKDTTDGYSLLQEALKFFKKKPKVVFHIPGENWIASDKEFVTQYTRSKIVVCLAKDEPFGLIPLEAMACGIPVLAVNEGGYKETVLNDKTGFLVLREPKSIADKLQFLLARPKLLNKIGKNARNHAVENWTWEKSAKNLKKAFNAKEANQIAQKINKQIKKISIILGIFIFSLLIHISTLNEMGRTWDEFLYVEEGYKMVEMMSKGDFDNSYFYTTYDHPPLVKYLYGLSAHLDVEKYLPNGEVLLRYDLTYSRLLSATVFSLGVVIVTFIGWQTISASVGIMAGIILMMLPFSLGLSQLVSTESFKIFIYPLAIYSYISFLKKHSIKKLIIAGIITGIALQIKQSNALLLPLFGLMTFFFYKKINKRKMFQKTFSLLFINVLTSILIFILIWPQVVFHLNEIYEIHSKLWHVQFSPNIWQITLSPPEVFFGRLMLTPTIYYIIYFFISIPLLIIIFFFLGIKEIFVKKQWILYVLFLWFIFPFILSVYSWRQHGLRYVIEIYPAISLIAALGFDALINKFSTRKYLKLVLFVPVIFYLIVILWQIKPYYLDYFNEVVGGTNTVYNYQLFQQGWWGQGEREAGLYLRDTARQGSTIGHAISPDHVFPRFDSFHYSLWQSDKKYDFVVVNHYHIIRDGFNDEEIRKNYQLVYEVRADRAVLVFVYKAK